FTSLRMGGLAAPPLIEVAVAGPDFDLGSVAGAAAGDVEAQSRLGADDGSVLVYNPALVGPAGAVPNRDGGSRRGTVAHRVEALVAVDLQCTIGQLRPILIGAAVAVPKRHLRAVGG